MNVEFSTGVLLYEASNKGLDVVIMSDVKLVVPACNPLPINPEK